jgi:Pyruvate/2-oxoacid:ferredoxin oxidoreductase gamma subunit
LSKTIIKQKNTFDIMIVGVGGQGTIRLGQFFQEFGLIHPEISSVVATESRGVSQREGSVQSFIRYNLNNQKKKEPDSNAKVSPVIPLQSCDLLIALEPLEFLRSLDYLSPNATILLNEQQLIPKSVIMNNAVYPDLKLCLDKIQIVYPNLTIQRKNYSIDALNSDQKMVVANYLMCKDLPNLSLGIFNHPKYHELLDFVFNVIKK